jgi:hypothetical protein
MAVRHEDGTEVEIGPGEAYVIEPGHDAWVLGDERFVGFEFESRGNRIPLRGRWSSARPSWVAAPCRRYGRSSGVRGYWRAMPECRVAWDAIAGA